MLNHIHHRIEPSYWLHEDIEHCSTLFTTVQCTSLHNRVIYNDVLYSYRHYISACNVVWRIYDSHWKTYTHMCMLGFACPRRIWFQQLSRYRWGYVYVHTFYTHPITYTYTIHTHPIMYTYTIHTHTHHNVCIYTS